MVSYGAGLRDLKSGWKVVSERPISREELASTGSIKRDGGYSGYSRGGVSERPISREELASTGNIKSDGGYSGYSRGGGSHVVFGGISGVPVRAASGGYSGISGVTGGISGVSVSGGISGISGGLTPSMRYTGGMSGGGSRISSRVTGGISGLSGGLTLEDVPPPPASPIDPAANRALVLEAKRLRRQKEQQCKLTPEDVVGVLHSRGWNAEIKKAADSPVSLVKVNPKGILKCVDGRGSDNRAMAGPKMLGGVYGIANCRGIKTTQELSNICNEVKAAGHVPSVHGDESGIMGCGFCKLWVTGGFDDVGLGIEKPNFTAREGADAVKAAGGVVENHYGAHAEKVVYINFCEDMTIEPDHDDQRFIVDAWAAIKFNLDVPKYLVTAAATVEKLTKGSLKTAVLIVPDPPLTPEDVVGVLQSRGWEAEIKEAADSPVSLVKVNPKGILKCVDGRGSDNKAMAGPKMLGGVYGIANCRGIKTTQELSNICKEVKAAGHVPSVHGDESGIMGCGFCKLWVTGGFDDVGLGIEKPNFTAQEGADAVKAAGGVIENHYGAHAEKVVYINFCEDMTLEPDHDDQRFIVDAWVAIKFNLDVPKYLVTAAATVEKLTKGSLKKAVLIVPPKKAMTPGLDLDEIVMGA